MKKPILVALMSTALLLPACSNWNRNTPANLDNKTIEEEVRKNMLADHITGLTVDVNGGTVTLKGHLPSSDKQKALEDARKVNGVTRVIDEISVQ
jgi:osmotically-inducible protein OsmY